MHFTILRANRYFRGTQRGLALALLTLLVFPQFATTQVSPAGTLLPDLTIDAARLQGSIVFKTLMFKSTDCALAEDDKCVDAPGKRTLMRFDVGIPNIGAADFYLGNPTNNSSLFTFSPCHGHYHLLGFASYELLDANRAIVVTGRKQAFCLEDLAKYSTTAGPAKYTCVNQGISVGWQDVYGSYLDCQWLDVTAVLPGNYTLRVIINAEAVASNGQPVSPALMESNYSNNVAEVPVKIGAKGKR